MDGSSPAQPVVQQVKAAACPAHGAFESRGLMLPFGTQRMIWSACPQCEREAREREEAERLANAERDRQERIERALNHAGIPLRFRSRTLANFLAETKGQQHALGVATRFVADWRRHESCGTTMVFSGAPGTGKSHLAIAIAQSLLSVTTVMYVSALDAIRMVRDTWRKGSGRSESEVLDLFAALGLLVLDEVGMQYGSEGEQVILFDIINRRYQDQRPMILLTNQGKAGLKEYLGDRAFDRLRESGLWVPFDWQSYRGKAAG